MKPEEYGFQLRVGNRRFPQFTMGFITMTRFNSGFKLNPGLKPNLKPDQINWVQADILATKSTHEMIIFTKFHKDRRKIEDFLLIATIWAREFFFLLTLYICT